MYIQLTRWSLFGIPYMVYDNDINQYILRLGNV